MLASAGVSGPEPSTSAKNATPVISSTVGVMMAATPHPYCAAPARASAPRLARLGERLGQGQHAARARRPGHA